MPAAYERWLAPAVFRPFAVDLAARAARQKPGRILEVAAGTGVLTRELVEVLPAADVTATDFNASMVSFGSQQASSARWEQADACSLPYPDGSFDLVVCQFGVMFFPDRPAAFAEARRVLRPEGRLLFSTWDAVDTHGFAAALIAGLERAFPGDPPGFIASVPHGYFDPELVGADLIAGGMELLAVEAVTLEGQAASAAEVAEGFIRVAWMPGKP